jgi:uncharacterized membrane protein YraQ (UPF0718 family)/copper chaperone CopZ
MELIVEILFASWSVFTEMAPYLLLGFFVAGVLSVLISPEWVERHLGGTGFGQVFKASLFGVPLPLCSCGVLPVAAGLRRQGASRGATTSFLLSTPQTGVDSIAVTYALLGPFIAVLRPLAALVTGVIGGSLVHGLAEGNGTEVDHADVSTSCAVDGCCEDDASHRHSFADAMRYGFVILPRDIGRALLIGVVLSGLISVLIAPDTLRAYLGGGLLPVLAAMAIGIPLYVCATASTPIALSLIVAGLSPGAALAFLISGPATNSAAVTTLWKVLGRRTTIIYLLTVAIGAIGTGLLVDGILATGVVPLSALVDTVGSSAGAHVEHHHAGGSWWWFQQASAVFLLLVMGYSMWPQQSSSEPKKAPAEDGADVVELKIKGMSCNGCVQSLTRALADVAGVSEVDVRLQDGTARVEGSRLESGAILEAVASLGFEVTNPEILQTVGLKS